MSLRAFGGPHLYLQGPDALNELGPRVAALGRRPFVVADGVVAGLIGPRIRAALGLEATFATFGGECTAGEIDRLAATAREAGADVVVGLGGGKAIDTAKGVRMALAAPLVIVPSIASNDSPTSRLAVLYTDDHVLAEVRLMATNPDVVLVDTSIIAQAPARFFAAGIGDALSKAFEVAQCARSGGLNFFKASPTELALAIADRCYAIVRADGVAALEAVKRRSSDASMERVVEATVLLSGLAFESGGLSIAHSLTRGFSAVPQVARALHGEQVALGLLAQLVAEEREAAFLQDLRNFYAAVGLPTSFSAFGIGDPEAVRTIVDVTWRTAPYIRNFTPTLTPERLTKALMSLLA